MIDMTYWCESCARKNNCYTIRNRPKCFTPITSNDRTADRKTEPQRGCDADCNEDCTECAKEWQDWKDQMWAEAVIASKTEPQTDDFFREPTAEERKAVAEYIESISIPTGVNVFDFMDEPQTEREGK